MVYNTLIYINMTCKLQTPNPGQIWEFTLLSGGNKNNNKQKTITNILTHTLLFHQRVVLGLWTILKVNLMSHWSHVQVKYRPLSQRNSIQFKLRETRYRASHKKCDIDTLTKNLIYILNVKHFWMTSYGPWYDVMFMLISSDDLCSHWKYLICFVSLKNQSWDKKINNQYEYFSPCLHMQ